MAAAREWKFGKETGDKATSNLVLYGQLTALYCFEDGWPWIGDLTTANGRGHSTGS